MIRVLEAKYEQVRRYSTKLRNTAITKYKIKKEIKQLQQRATWGIPLIILIIILLKVFFGGNGISIIQQSTIDVFSK